TIHVARYMADALRSSVMTPSEWATSHRRIGDRAYSFEGYEWCKWVHDAEMHTDKIVSRKGAQTGLTETFINLSFFFMDVRLTDVLYLLPLSDEAADFSAGRFNPAAEDSPAIAELMRDVNSVHHKRARYTSMYIRGTNSRSKLKSIPVGAIFYDEFDEMNQLNLKLARHRLSGHVRKFEAMISTPTIPGFGIDLEFANSSQGLWMVKCPKCGRRHPLDFPASIEYREVKGKIDARSARYKCRKCGKPWTPRQHRKAVAGGEYVHQYKRRATLGFAISQMYSSTVSAQEIIEAYIERFVSAPGEQEFYNSVLGIAHVAAGTMITPADIANCTQDDLSIIKSANHATLGIDPGPHHIHYEVAQWLQDGTKLVLDAGWVPEFRDLDDLMIHYQVYCAVIDAQPERHEARKFVDRWDGLAYMCFYTEHGPLLCRYDEETGTVNANRTEALRSALNRFTSRTVRLPKGLTPEYAQHICCPVLVYRTGPKGNVIGEYLTPGEAPDHLAHCAAYNELANEICPEGDWGGEVVHSGALRDVQ
ncbi:MAG: phage terminase large subunit family protein, partial [Actinomycetota bacterium]|nr:phage terminase large subunit family protein [Actinomycetota bacterium]